MGYYAACITLNRTLSHLRYAKGHRPTTCYAYNADLGLWRDWLTEAGKD